MGPKAKVSKQLRKNAAIGPGFHQKARGFQATQQWRIQTVDQVFRGDIGLKIAWIYEYDWSNIPGLGRLESIRFPFPFPPLSASLFACLPICLPSCLPVSSLALCRFACLPACLIVFLPVISWNQFLWLSVAGLSGSLSAGLSSSLFASLSLCLYSVYFPMHRFAFLSSIRGKLMF